MQHCACSQGSARLQPQGGVWARRAFPARGADAPAISRCPLGDSCPVGCCIHAALPTLCLVFSGSPVPTFLFPGSGPSGYPAARSASGFLESPAGVWGPWRSPIPLIPASLDSGREGGDRCI